MLEVTGLYYLSSENKGTDIMPSWEDSEVINHSPLLLDLTKLSHLTHIEVANGFSNEYVHFYQYVPIK